MRKPRPRTDPSSSVTRTSEHGEQYCGELKKLHRRLAEAEAELSVYRSKQQWLLSALASQRHARQVLEAGVSASYIDTVSRIREVVNSILPREAILIVISKGDEELLRFEQRRAWHFPQNENGIYAGHYPAEGAEAISQLQSLIARGGEYLLIPNTAFWWLEHYRELREWLEHCQSLVWRDERCAIFRLSHEISTVSGRPASNSTGMNRTEKGPNGVLLLKATRRKRPDILCFPIIDWDFRFQRPQQLMSRFAAAGHRVFYVSNQFQKSGPAYALRSLAPRLWEVSLRGPRYNAYQGMLDEGYCEALLGAVSELCVDESIESGISVVQSPFWWPLARQVACVSNSRILYDCMDHHAGFSTSNPILIEQEHELLARADLVVTTSKVLERQARSCARNVLLVRNGCDYGHFAKASALPGRKRRPVIGYYGAIAEWFDGDLVADLAERRPGWDFLLVGSTFGADVHRLSKLRNVSLPGEKPYAQIPSWLAKFDVAILPFKRTPLTEAANPVKAYEIFASGKPLVSVPLPEMTPLAPLARLASTVDEFEREIQAELNLMDPDLQRRRRAFARENTWDQRFRELSSGVESLLVRRVPAEPALKRKRQNQKPASFV